MRRNSLVQLGFQRCTTQHTRVYARIVSDGIAAHRDILSCSSCSLSRNAPHAPACRTGRSATVASVPHVLLVLGTVDHSSPIWSQNACFKNLC